MAIAGPTTDHHEIRLWAQSRAAVPVEILPSFVDGEPALLRLMPKEQANDMPNVRVIGWEEFFCKFDALGLTLVYDNASTDYNEILQRDEHSPYRHPDHHPKALQN